IGGAFTNNGTVTSSGILNFTPTTPVTINVGTGLSSTGIVSFGGSGAITMSGTPAALQNVIIANTNNNGLTPAGGWTVNGNLFINGNAILNAGSASYTVAGDMESDGTLNGGTSTFTLTSAAGLLFGSPGTTFNNLTVTGNYTANSDFQVAGNFTDNGTLDASLGQLTMTGSGSSSISGSANPLVLAQLGVNKSVGTTVTLSQNLGSIISLHLSKGILDAGAFTLTQDVGGGDLAVDDSAVLRIGGTNTLPTFTTYELDTLSTIDYAGTTQSIPATTTYGGLTISAAGTKTAAAALSIAGSFTLSNGTFTGGTFTHNVGGNWLMSSGSFVNTGTTIQLNGIAAQTVSSTGAFNNLTINNTGGLVSLAGNSTVNNVLAFTAGKLSLLDNNLTIGSSGTITGASATSYIVALGAGTLVQTVSNGGSKPFPIGTNTSYTPATIALSPASVTDNFGLRMLDAVYYLGTTGTTVQSGAVNATWMITKGAAGSTNATVTLQWPGSLELPGFIRSASRLAHYFSGSWDYGASDIAAAGSDPYTVSRSGFTSFSPFTVSSFGALPVTWLDVSGQHIGTDNYIYWSTASSTNNDHFVIEVSGNGSGFSPIGQVAGRSNSTSVQQYSFVDRNVLLPTAWYRIKQVDIDSQYSYSKTILLTGTAAPASGFSYISNPASSTVTGTIGSTKTLSATLTITDLGGKVVKTQAVTLNIGSNPIRVDISNQPNGLYLIQYVDEYGNRQVRKFIKQ
ncbi:MAG TPA: T9SS type A sorting domain-containing protein, partial [Puia sp.]